METSSVDDEFHGPSIDARLGVEDMASLVVVLLMLKCQDLGDNESGARIIVTKDLVIFIHLPMHGHVLKGFHFFFAHRVVGVIVVAIMICRVGHWYVLWPRPWQVKHLMELVLSVSSFGVVDDEALSLKLLVVGG